MRTKASSARSSFSESSMTRRSPGDICAPWPAMARSSAAMARTYWNLSRWQRAWLTSGLGPGFTA
jgi:hypothetical protein